MKNKEIFESKEFKEACEEYLENMAAEYPYNEKQHIFSDEFESKMDVLLNQQPNRKLKLFNTVGKRVAVIIVVIFIALTTTVFSVKAIRIPIIDFLVRVYEEFTSLFVSAEVDYDDDFVFEQKSPAYIVEGFEVEVTIIKDYMYQVDYVSENNIKYYYKQDVLYQNQQIDLDNNSDIIELNGVKYYYYNNRDNKIVWHDDIYSYMIFGSISKDEMIEVAKSVE